MTTEDRPRNPNWGGKRPGAGAPKGNLNALKHGRRSKQFAEIGALIAQSDTARNALLAAAHRRHSAEAKAEETAAAIVIDLFLHARGIAQGKDSPGPFRHLLDAGGMGACPERPDRSRGSRRVAAGKATPGPFQHRARLNDPAKASSAPQSSRSPAQLNADLIEIARLTATNPPDNQPSKPQSSDPLDPDTNQPPNPHD